MSLGRIVVCIAKNEPNIDEWIDYHLRIGFDRVVVYANDWNYERAGDPQVTVEYWVGKAQQMPVYNHALQTLDFQWAAFIDCDEYIVCPEGLDSFLATRSVSFSVPWKIFGNKQSEGATAVERFRYWDYDPNRHVKTIVHRSARAVGKFTNPHYIANVPMVTPEGARHLGPFMPKQEAIGRIWIKHLYYQDREYWDVKIERGRSDIGKKRTGESWEDGNKFNTYEEVV